MKQAMNALPKMETNRDKAEELWELGQPIVNTLHATVLERLAEMNIPATILALAHRNRVSIGVDTDDEDRYGFQCITHTVYDYRLQDYKTENGKLVSLEVPEPDGSLRVTRLAAGIHPSDPAMRGREVELIYDFPGHVAVATNFEEDPAERQQFLRESRERLYTARSITVGFELFIYHEPEGSIHT